MAGIANILLVEDDDVDVMNVRRALHKARITCNLYVAENGVQALEMLRRALVPAARRIMLLDINMPRMNGIELLREIRQDPALRPLTVIVLTTSNDARDRVEAYRLNVAGYLIKPVRFASFVDIMARLDDYWAIMELP